MIPYIFAAGHWIVQLVTARDNIVYLRTMEELPTCSFDTFMDRELVLHLKDGFSHRIWSDMAFETTYMKFGRSIQ